MTPTDQDLDQLKKMLDIMGTYGVSSLEMGAIKVVLSPNQPRKATTPVVSIDPKTQQMAELRERLQDLAIDDEQDLYYST